MGGGVREKRRGTSRLGRSVKQEEEESSENDRPIEFSLRLVEVGALMEGGGVERLRWW